MKNSAIELYLDLIKRSLTNNIFSVEPDSNDENHLRYVQAAISHYQQSAAVSMIPLVRMDNLQSCIEAIKSENIEGDFVETGVWRGGSVIFMAACMKAFEITGRKIWAADSFEGLPVPDEELFPLEYKAYKSAAMSDKYYNHLAVGLMEVKRNFEAYGLLDDNIIFLEGWFKDTLPTAPIEKISLLRLDGDYYDSTMDSLTNLYDKVSSGGFVIIDDYGEDHWTYCKKAVDDFRLQRGIDEPMIKVDKPCYFWKKN